MSLTKPEMNHATLLGPEADVASPSAFTIGLKQNQLQYDIVRLST